MKNPYKYKHVPIFVDKDFEASSLAIKWRFKNFKKGQEMIKTIYRAIPELHHLDAMFFGEWGIRRIQAGKEADIWYFRWLYQTLLRNLVEELLNKRSK